MPSERGNGDSGARLPPMDSRGEEIRKLHAEILQLDNQRFLLVNATVFNPAVDFMEGLSDIILSSEGRAQIEPNPVTVGILGAAAVDAAVMRQQF